jgi:hypothetical protein
MMSNSCEAFTDCTRWRSLSRSKPSLEFSSAAEDGRPGVEAAWAMCPKTEERSVVWTSEMAEAFGLCRDLLPGDEIGARMVFKEQYPGLVSAARLAHTPVRWIVCLGWDVNDRVRALSEAVEKKRIKPDHAFGLLRPAQQDELLLALPPPEHKLLIGEIKKNPIQLTGLQAVIHALAEKNAMPPLPAPRRVAERTDEERAEHAKRVREQAARLKEYGKRGSTAQSIPLIETAAEPETDAERGTIQ